MPIPSYSASSTGGSFTRTMDPVQLNGWQVNASVAQNAPGQDYTLSANISKVDTSVIPAGNLSATGVVSQVIPVGQVDQANLDASLDTFLNAAADYLYDFTIPTP